MSARWRRRLLWPLVVALGAGAEANARWTSPAFDARGVVAGHALVGPVDSPTAAAWLEGRPLPPSLVALRTQWTSRNAVPTREELGRVARHHSPDVATLLFLEAVEARPEARRFRARFERELAVVRRHGPAHDPPRFDDVEVVVVPGWFHEAFGAETGADLASQRRVLESLGVSTRFVAVDENGTVEANARQVADALRAIPHDRRVVIVSASKGGPEVARALGRELAPSEVSHVRAWLSIGGVLRGTPFADRVFLPDLCWLAQARLAWDGFDLEGARSVRTSRRRADFDTLTLPPHVHVVAFVPVPL